MSVVYGFCHQCRGTHRIERLGPSTTVNSRWFCPGCGSDILVEQRARQDYWYVMAASFGLPDDAEGAELIKQIHETWDTTEYAKFRDYVEALRTSKVAV